MLDQKDLQAIAELMDCRISKTEEKMIKEMDSRIWEVETNLTNRILEVESFLTKELVRTEDILTRKMNKMSSKLEEIGEYYRVEKLENGNMGMVLQMLESYNVRLKKLEMGFA